MLAGDVCASASAPVQVVSYAIFVICVIGSIVVDCRRDPVEAKQEWIGVFKENVTSIGALSLFIALYTFAFLQEWILTADNIGGLVITIIGLTVFARGLAMGLMPLAENVGRELPVKIPLPVVLITIFCLGVLCTIAEPSIQALQSAGSTVDFESAPFVSILLSATYKPTDGDDPQNWVGVLKILVGVGVGVAAVVGTMRLIFQHAVKGYALSTFIPPMILTIIACLWYTSPPEHLERSTGLAWDCGAVTTGPVTVPIVLAIGIGMASASKAKRAAAATGDDVNQSICQPVYGSVSGSRSVLVQQNESRRSESMISGGSLMLGSKRGNTLAREAAEALEGQAQAEEEGPNLDGFGIVTFASLIPAFTVWALTFYTYNKFKDVIATDEMALEMSSGVGPLLAVGAVDSFWCSFSSALMSSVQAVGPLVGFLMAVQFVFVRKIPEGFFGIATGCFVTLLGMVLFNVGLTRSLSPIGVRVGELMPSAQDKYGKLAGDVVMLVFGFLAGVGATFSEPALNALGDTVHALTKGEFKKNSLIGSVALGVGIGIMIGLAKIRYSLPLYLILIVAYTIAFALTAVSPEAITCVAWDSAGVTTGPVTVPIVLALGGSIAQTNHVAEGFGILACASFGPIIAVLSVAKIQELTSRKK